MFVLTMIMLYTLAVLGVLRVLFALLGLGILVSRADKLSDATATDGCAKVVGYVVSGLFMFTTAVLAIVQLS